MIPPVTANLPVGWFGVHDGDGRPRVTDPVRIGNCSGFYGDRLAAMREMLTGGDWTSSPATTSPS